MHSHYHHLKINQCQKKITNLLIPYLMIIKTNIFTQLISAQNWHSSEPTNHYSCKVTFIQYTLIFTHNNAHCACHTHMTIIICLIAAKYQQNTTPLVCKKKPLKAVKINQNHDLDWLF